MNDFCPTPILTLRFVDTSLRDRSLFMPQVGAEEKRLFG